VAGTGTDAAPYFRIFNPVSQGLRFDPEGDYVRRWVPELRGLGGADAHQPWEQPLFAGDGYPAPIVDHAAERDEALARLEATRQQ
jgi:deoxyribodipyrimidine photo-lyase